MSNKEQQPTPEQIEFLKAIFAQRKEKVEQLAYQALALSLKADICVYDLPYYILMRAKAILEDAFHTVSFNYPELQEARKQFLKKCLIEMKSKIIVPPNKEEKDETDVRDNRCEPLAQAVANMMLDPELIFSDNNYFDKVLADEERTPLYAAVMGYSNALDEKTTMIVGEHFKKAQKILFGKEREDILFSEMEKILTPKKKK